MKPKLEVNKKSVTFGGILSKLAILVYFSIVASLVIYIYAFAQDRYVSEAEFKISENNSTVAAAGILSAALPGLVDSVSTDSKIATSYIASADLLFELEEQFKMREHYSSPEKDFYFRLSLDANKEERLEYYRERISSHYSQETGLTIISVESYDPKFSESVAKHLLQKAEEFVNGVNQQIADQQFVFLHKELERAEKNLEEANLELRDLQNKYEFISPEQKIESIVSAIENMNLQILKIKGEIATLVRDSPDSPRIELMRSQVRSLEDLVEAENSKLSGPKKDSLNMITQEFGFIKSKIEFRAQLLAGAQLLIERNRSEAITNSKFFTVIQNPFTPEDALLPRRLYTSVTIVILGILIFIILKILLQSVFERG